MSVCLLQCSVFFRRGGGEESDGLSMFDCLPLLNTLNTNTHTYTHTNALILIPALLNSSYIYTFNDTRTLTHTHIYWGAHLAWLAALSSPHSLVANTAVVAAKYLFIVVVSVLE